MNPPIEEHIKLPLFKQLNNQLPIGQDKNKNYLLFILIAYTTMLLITLFCMVYQNHNTGQSAGTANKRSLMILSELNDMHGQLQQMVSSQNPADIKNTVSTLANELSNVEKSLADNAKSTEIKKINEQLVTMQNDLSDLEKTVSTQFNQKKYIDIKSLPFQVNYLDMISGQPFVSVNYDHHVSPLGIGDRLNGWTMTAANYTTQTVEFGNEQGQFIKVTLAS